MVSDKADFTLWDVSIPAAAGKIHLGRLFQGPPGLRFQFPQLRVRYIRAARRAEPGIKLSIPAAAGKIHRRGRTGTSVPPLSIPAAAGKIHRRGRTGTSVPPLSIPAAAGKIHKARPKLPKQIRLSIPAAAGKIHRKNNESTLHICGTICAAFCLCLLYYRGSLKPCLPFAQKAKRNFPVFVFSRVRSPVL